MSELPRVTSILTGMGLGPDLGAIALDVLAGASARGTAVHAAIEALTYGVLDEATVAPEIAPYVSAYRKFLAESRFEAIAAEVQVIHPTWGYQGHPDLVGWINGLRVIVDVKTGTSQGAAYQVGLYVAAWNAMHPTECVTAGLILQLRDDGTYRVEEIDLPDAIQVGLAAVLVSQARRRR